MYFEFPCTKCQKKLKVSEEHRGRKVRCPYCHHGETVPALRAPAAEEDPLSFLSGPASSGRGPVAPSATAVAPSATAASGAAAPKPVPPRRETPSAGGEQAVSGTDVSALHSGLIGLAVFVAVYLALFPFRDWYLGQLLWKRGWVQFAEVFLAAWAGVILVMKTRRLTVQRDSMLFDLLPEDIAPEITPQTVGRFTAHIRQLPVKIGESFLVNRVLRGLEHFRVLQDNGEVANRLASQSEIDGNEVSASYSLVKVFVWAIPILGFIGTVIGIGQAVGSFSSTMSAAGDLSAMKEAFNSVTAGLATAFDTTLLALVLSMFIMFPMSAIQKSENNLLNWVDEYCNENLLKRCKGADSAGAAVGADPTSLQAAVDAALVPHLAELKAWSKKLEAIGEAFGQQMAKGWAQLDEQVQNRHAQLMRDWCKSAEAHQAAMAESGQAIRAAGESLQRYFAAMEQGLGSLNAVLASLGEKQVVVQGEVRRRRLWGLFRRRGG